MSRRSRRKSSVRKSSGSRLFKWIAIGGGLFFLLAIVGLVLGYRAVREYLRSDDFRMMLEEKASDSLGGKARFQPFNWEGWSFTTDEFEFTGEETVSNLRLSNIGASVDIGAVWDGIYRVENVTLRQIELTADLRGGDEVAQEEVEARRMIMSQEDDDLDQVLLCGLEAAVLEGNLLEVVLVAVSEEEVLAAEEQEAAGKLYLKKWKISKTYCFWI